MTRWRFELYRDGADEPFHSDLHEADGPGAREEAGLPLGLAVGLRVALDDDRVARIELRREP